MTMPGRGEGERGKTDHRIHCNQAQKINLLQLQRKAVVMSLQLKKLLNCLSHKRDHNIQCKLVTQTLNLLPVPQGKAVMTLQLKTLKQFNCLSHYHKKTSPHVHPYNPFSHSAVMTHIVCITTPVLSINHLSYALFHLYNHPTNFENELNLNGNYYIYIFSGFRT